MAALRGTEQLSDEPSEPPPLPPTSSADSTHMRVEDIFPQDPVRSAAQRSAIRRGSPRSRNRSARTLPTIDVMRNVERPIRPANAGTFPSGNSSYNLNFIDWENEWETYLDDAPPGGYDVEYSSDDSPNDGDDVRLGPRYGVSWTDEHRNFWSQIESMAQARFREVSQPYSNLVDLIDDMTSTQNCTDQWNDERIRRLDQAVGQRGGFVPSRAAMLMLGSFKDLSTDMNHAGATCGICLEKLEEDDRCYRLCHAFHASCIRPWFFRSQECPLCRQNFDEFT